MSLTEHKNSGEEGKFEGKTPKDTISLPSNNLKPIVEQPSPNNTESTVNTTKDSTNPTLEQPSTFREESTKESEHEKRKIPRSRRKRTLLDWRRNYVWELRAKGYSIKQITEELTKNNTNVSISEQTVRKDINLKLREIESRFEEYVEKDLVKEHHLAKTGLESVLQSAWVIFNREEDNERKLSALRVINETYALLQKLTGDPEIVKEAIDFVVKMKKKKQGVVAVA